ncbi:MAG: amidohydrolase [Lachnospiraceae bacterium]|jgi:aminobenzoyl-glutamate utilization protein B|nr:amidohydrolase [Lachnospiraceae bacterium]
MLGNIAVQEIDKIRPILDELSRKIWETPEAGFKEFQASDNTAKVLEEAGFTVERKAGGVTTAIKASFGSGHPVIGFMGEFDSLPGLNQKATTDKDSDNPGAYGHGCGHNLMCAAHVGAVIGLKEEMIKNNLPGTIIFYACPGEELLTGKGFMARGGAFEGLDCAINFHPSKVTEVTIGTSTAVNSFRLHFKGRSSHAGSDPQNGRSALDALELTNVGINFLREHVPEDVRMHYIITEGGVAPNIVPDIASGYYYVRAFSREKVEDTFERMIKVAKGAAMMTETEVEVEFTGGCYNTMNNHVLAGVVKEAMDEVPQEEWDEKDLAFAKDIDKHNPALVESLQAKYGLPEGMHLYEGGGAITNFNSFGSTDMGDVMHIVPTAYCFTGCTSLGTPNHSWQFCACAGSSIGEKGMILGAKIMAVFGAKLLNNPKIVKEAKAEFDKAMNGRTYKCPIPKEIPAP